MPDNQKKLLIVDDEPVVADFMARVLEKQGFAVDVATDGQTAKRFIDGKDYDVAVVDMRMPKMNGRQLYDYIKSARPRMAKSVIFTSGELVDAATAGFLASEGLFFLNKPFGTEALKSAVEKTLQGSALK
jgi:DNA-binding NtrC family response regulator